MKFHTLQVANVTPETEQAVAVSFKVPTEMKETYQYRAGQYLTLKFTIDGEEHRRAYSMCSSPMEEVLTIGVKRVENGVVSNHINDTIKPGSHVEVVPPQGNFTPNITENIQKSYVLFGGGSGITPLLSIAKTVLSKDSNSTLTLLYANEGLDTIMFKGQLEDLESKYGSRFKVDHILNNPPADWQGKSGLVNAEIIKSILDGVGSNYGATEFYICGPSGMMEVVENSLETLNVPKNKIHIERFVAAESDPDKQAEINASTKDAMVKVDFFGDVKDIQVPQGISILDALKNNGIDAPFSCQSGVCSTCIATLTKGEVAMDFTEALDDDEIEDGLILTCQAKCLTDEIEVTFED